ncbi:hypothetical protein [Chryseobacterium sp. OSA05B]|uniref:hypothetical protein n=1 Tax=Chryseobacterium sp. OSA05B TaxID=2862650 RepID=UPI001CBD1D5E|nr:hypothetical protein [Chryseobacterium sp. OSA05B]
MKKSKLYQTIQYTLVVLVTAVLLGFSSSCSNDDDDDAPARQSHKVVFKATASAGSNIDVAVYGYDSTITTASSLSGTTWTSPEITTPAGAVNVNVGVNATGSSSSSTLKVQIYVDGELKKEGTSSGQVLSASANYTF